MRATGLSIFTVANSATGRVRRAKTNKIISSKKEGNLSTFAGALFRGGREKSAGAGASRAKADLKVAGATLWYRRKQALL